MSQKYTRQHYLIACQARARLYGTQQRIFRLQGVSACPGDAANPWP